MDADSGAASRINATRPHAPSPPRHYIGDWTDAEIKTHLKIFADKGVISKYGIPEKILFVEKLAKTSVGKINKKELREKYGAM